MMDFVALLMAYLLGLLTLPLAWAAGELLREAMPPKDPDPWAWRAIARNRVEPLRGRVTPRGGERD